MVVWRGVLLSGSLLQPGRLLPQWTRVRRRPEHRLPVPGHRGARQSPAAAGLLAGGQPCAVQLGRGGHVRACPADVDHRGDVARPQSNPPRTLGAGAAAGSLRLGSDHPRDHALVECRDGPVATPALLAACGAVPAPPARWRWTGLAQHGRHPLLLGGGAAVARAGGADRAGGSRDRRGDDRRCGRLAPRRGGAAPALGAVGGLCGNARWLPLGTRPADGRGGRQRLRAGVAGDQLGLHRQERPAGRARRPVDGPPRGRRGAPTDLGDDAQRGDLRGPSGALAVEGRAGAQVGGGVLRRVRRRRPGPGAGRAGRLRSAHRPGPAVLGRRHPGGGAVHRPRAPAQSAGIRVRVARAGLAPSSRRWTRRPDRAVPGGLRLRHRRAGARTSRTRKTGPT